VSSTLLFFAFFQATFQFLSIKLCYIFNYKGKLISGRQINFSLRSGHDVQAKKVKKSLEAAVKPIGIGMKCRDICQVKNLKSHFCIFDCLNFEQPGGRIRFVSGLIEKNVNRKKEMKI